MGDAYDNAMCESFFATLECELLDRRRFKTPAEARNAVFGFIGASTIRDVVIRRSARFHRPDSSRNTTVQQPSRAPTRLRRFGPAHSQRKEGVGS